MRPCTNGGIIAVPNHGSHLRTDPDRRAAGAFGQRRCAGPAGPRGGGAYFDGTVSLSASVHPHDGDIAALRFAPQGQAAAGNVKLRVRQANGRMRCLRAEYRRDAQCPLHLMQRLQDAKSLPRTQVDAALTTNFRGMRDNAGDCICFKGHNHCGPVERSVPSLRSSIGAGCRPIPFGADLSFAAAKPHTFPGLTVSGADLARESARHRDHLVGQRRQAVRDGVSLGAQVLHAGRRQRVARLAHLVGPGRAAHPARASSTRASRSASSWTTRSMRWTPAPSICA